MAAAGGNPRAAKLDLIGSATRSRSVRQSHASSAHHVIVGLCAPPTLDSILAAPRGANPASPGQLVLVPRTSHLFLSQSLAGA